MDIEGELGKRRLSDMSWLGIVHVFAELCGVDVKARYSGGYWCEVDYSWTKPLNADGGPSVLTYCTGLSKGYPDEEESARHLLRGVFRYTGAETGPFKALPRLEFETKEELELKLAAANFDPEFMLTHRSG